MFHDDAHDIHTVRPVKPSLEGKKKREIISSHPPFGSLFSQLTLAGDMICMGADRGAYSGLAIGLA